MEEGQRCYQSLAHRLVHPHFAPLRTALDLLQELHTTATKMSALAGESAALHDSAPLWHFAQWTTATGGTLDGLLRLALVRQGATPPEPVDNENTTTLSWAWPTLCADTVYPFMMVLEGLVRDTAAWIGLHQSFVEDTWEEFHTILQHSHEQLHQLGACLKAACDGLRPEED